MGRATAQTKTGPLFERPFPSRELLDAQAGVFLPAPEVEKFLREMFVSESGPFYDPENAHLNAARIGVLWTNNELKIGGSRKAAVALMPGNKGMGKLDKDLWAFMMLMFFRVPPHFLIIFDAAIAAAASDRQFLITGGHELKHCAQKKKGGVPQYHKGTKDYAKIYTPVFAMRPHDHELFTSDLRFGARAVLGPETVEIILQSELDGPEISDDYIRSMCGTCALA